jgi:hypothetical protein
MTRTFIAVIGGLLGLAAYVAIVLVLADSVLSWHWSLQALYFVMAGSLWVPPIRWLMLWAAHLRG